MRIPRRGDARLALRLDERQLERREIDRAIVGILDERILERACERRRHVLRDRAQGRDVLDRMTTAQRVAVLRSERRHAGEHPVSETPDEIDVFARVRAEPEQPLGCHRQQRRVLRLCLAEHTGDPEVDDLDRVGVRALAQEHHARGPERAVIDACSVRSGHAAAELAQHRNRTLDRERTTRERRREIFAVELLVRERESSVAIAARPSHLRQKWRLDARERADDPIDIVERIGLASELAPQHVDRRVRLARGIIEQLTIRVGPKRAAMARRRAHGWIRREQSCRCAARARPRTIASTSVGYIGGVPPR